MRKGIKVIAIGAVLWDIIGDKEYIGGAPFNFAVNMARLGADAVLLTAVGNDAHGERAVEKMQEYGITKQFVQVSNTEPTGFAKATLDENRNAVYDIPYSAFDDIRVEPRTVRELNDRQPEIIYFGSFEQRGAISRNTVQTVLRQVKANCVFFDVNLRMGCIDKDVLSFGFAQSNIVKCNETESQIICQLFYGETFAEHLFAERIMKEFSVDCVVITLGDKGCNVYSGEKQYRGKPIVAKNGDTIGAGDAFSAAFAASYLSGEGIEKAADKGNLLGAFVACQFGALPHFTQELFEKLQ